MCIRTEKAQRLIERLNHLVLENAGQGYSDIHITGGLRLVSISFLPSCDPAAEKKKRDTLSFVAKMAFVTLVITCVVACTWLGVMKKPPLSDVTLLPAVPSSAGEERIIENNHSITAVTSTANLENTPGKEGGMPQVTVTPGIYRGEYGGTAIEAVQGQTYVIRGDNDKILPLLPMPEKRLIVPLAIRMSEEVRHQVPSAKISSSPSSSRPMPAQGESAAGLVDGTAITPTRINTIQPMMSNPYGKAVIYFPANRYRLTDSEKDQIKLFLPYLKMASRDGHMALVQGYTCDLGSKDKNDFLAMERAKAVAGYLEQNGVKIGGIKGEGKHGYISKRRELNRRVEVETSKQTEPRKQS